MKPAPFRYVSPETIAAALDLLADNVFDAKILAGGQSLIPAMNFRLTQPAFLIDINHLGELDYIREASNHTLRIGALTRQRTLERSKLVQKNVPLLSETVPFIAHPQIRNRGTIGGSLAHADPAAELPAILVALEGRIRVKNRSGERWVGAEEFFTGIFTTDLSADEIIVEIEIPSRNLGEGWSFQEFSRRKGDYALLGVACIMTLDSRSKCRTCRLVYMNAGETPLVASTSAQILEGETLTEDLLEDVARDASKNEIYPLGNIHASVPYLRFLAFNLTKRALRTAKSRAQLSLESPSD